MENLIIEGTNQSLSIDFNTNGQLKLQGISTPDHVNRFFDPLFEWVKNFSRQKPDKVEVDMFIDYLNTSSTRVLVEFIKLIDSLKENGTKVIITWKYEDDDEDMMEFGEDLALISGAEITLKPVEVE